jgi:hypothetical protein
MPEAPGAAEVLTRLVGAPVPLGVGVFLVIHVAAGLVCVIAGAVALLSAKQRGRHPRAGEVYFWAWASSRAKFLAYHRYWASAHAARCYDGLPVVLVVTTGPGPEQRIARALRAADAGQARALPALVTTVGLFVAGADGPLGRSGAALAMLPGVGRGRTRGARDPMSTGRRSRSAPADEGRCQRQRRRPTNLRPPMRTARLKAGAAASNATCWTIPSTTCPRSRAN